MPPEATDVTALPPLRRNRDFMLLWTGQVVSTVGSRASGVAFPLLVLTQTGSPSKAGLVGFAATLPFPILFLVAGIVVDRVDRKRLLLVSEAARALAFASLVAAFALDRVTLGHILAVAFVEGTFFVFFRLAESAALPRVVPKPQLPTAVAQNQARDQGAELAGSPLGGFLFQLDRALPFVFDAVSYTIGFLTLLFVRTPLQAEREPATTRVREELAEGIRFTWREPFIRAIVVLVAGSNFAFNALFLVLIVRAKELGASAGLIGAMFAILGAGALLGALVAPTVARHVPARYVLVGILWIWAAYPLLLALLPNAIALGLVGAVAGTLGPIFNVVLSAYRYALVPDRLQGRVGSVILLVAWGTIPLGAIAAGVMLETLGAVESMLVIAGVNLAVAVGAIAARTVR
ncbi:MAG: MFS transporter, partial [Thermoleophilia bacterium]|nr:MFS transporter [Thermoleophilia bacterium]